MKICVKPDCANAPKKERIRELTIAFSQGDIPGILEKVSDDIKLTMVGEAEFTGKKELKIFVDAMNRQKMDELKIEKIITHGKEGSVLGYMIMSGGRKYAFADFYDFKSAGDHLVKKMTSFVIEINPG